MTVSVLTGGGGGDRVVVSVVVEMVVTLSVTVKFTVVTGTEGGWTAVTL
jgi:hypothetical protein